MTSKINVRPARTADVKAIQAMRQELEGSKVLLGHELVSLYEAVPEFLVAVDESGQVIGAGALHVMWEDLAEVRSMVVRENLRGTGVGHAVLEALLAKAESVGIKRVFCLTFETEFFGKHGFKEISDVPVDEVTFEQMVRSHDDGVAEFLDLARVKQNTLGNTRMLKTL
ncbi:amino-acid N-acetyltransferase [Rhodoluna lacicola]|jgi:amino-acid N-acetyltransferase|uniref:N-acetylglutamate synthase-related acetyltransferase n=1 Tax=Rhodoluna lacicola TaxID=529884 RepID=A0A060JL51_9MICO|nr:amino-acid N-acetyltransferase [Rhodoluna lacicola]AIC47004.1 N-acetylglutamate synthase-related acetyltransferase [Rhodoluna lacicola]BDS49909.1 N-acetylglutamate synthase [Rhodoluna lacicola]